MDTLTHALSGALVGRMLAPARAEGTVPARDCVALGFLAAAFPDADVVLSALSPLAYLFHHRGLTHALPMVPVWAVLLGWAWSRLRRNPAGLRTYAAIAAAAILTHILGDLITSFGTMIFAPFSDARVAWSTTFIIDLWFSGILLVGLGASVVLKTSRAPAVCALAALTGYVGFQYAQQQRAIAWGEAHARANGLPAVQVVALPRPVSPFNWMVVIVEEERYRYAFVNLRRSEPLAAGPDAGFLRALDAPYEPMRTARWHEALRYGGERALGASAWASEGFAFFRWFAQFPVAVGVERGNPSTCVWFRDLRFLTPGRSAWPFQYGMCREGEAGPWQPYELDGGRRIDLLR